MATVQTSVAAAQTEVWAVRGTISQPEHAFAVCSALFGPAAMPVSASHSQVVYDALRACGVRLLSVLPETWLVHLVGLAEEDPEMTLVRLAKEEEGVGIS